MPFDGQLLVALARASLVESLGGDSVTLPDEAWLHEPGATFVTLTQGGELRGCIGTIEPRRGLGEDVVGNAKHAAFHDPRFPPLERNELAKTEIEVTVLSPIEPLPCASEEDALQKLRPGVDGVLLTSGHRRAVFIPQMWEKLPEPREFLRYLKMKGGIFGWPKDTRVERFTATAFHEVRA